MSSFLITQTPFSSVRPIDPSVRLTGERLRNILRQHLDPEELAEFQTLFADPEPVVGAAATDWYTDFAELGVPVSELEVETREAILTKVGRIGARIAQIADLIEADTPGSSDAAYLRAAIAIPDNNDYIYAFEGKPVIVAWGHKLAGAGRAPAPIGLWTKSASDNVADTGTKAQVNTAQEANDSIAETALVAAGGVAAPAGIGWLAWLLWAVFLILFLIILWIVLSACSMGGPQTTLAQRLGLLNRCPMPVHVAQAPVLEQSDRAAVLRQAIRDAELALAEDAQQCRVVRREEDAARRAPLEQNRAPVPPITDELPQDQALTNEADDRVREAGGQTGEMQVVLQWDGPADLDMSVACSSGNISYSNRSSCDGGELDVDANYEINMDRPVENIHWAETPPPGVYGLQVRNHSNKGDQRSQIPFTVLVRQGDEERTYNGRVAQGQSVSVTDIVVE